MKRRDFLAQTIGGVTLAAVASRSDLFRDDELLAIAQGHAASLYSNAAKRRQRIAISTWSFHNFFPPTRSKSTSLPEKTLDLLDFPGMIADRYQVHHLEFVAPHFASTEPSYLGELKARLAKARSHLVNIPMDIRELHQQGGLSSPEPGARATAIDAAKKWIDAARALGALSVRCDPGKMNPDDLSPTVESYKVLAAYGKSKGIYVIIENHGGVGSEHPEELVKVFQQVGGDFIGALPDFGNFPDEATRERGLALLFPYARTVCHAKGLEFDANGSETRFDFRKCVEISKQAAYKGVYSIEYEGAGDPYDGVQKVVDELVRFL